VESAPARVRDREDFLPDVRKSLYTTMALSLS
jgi:hypothetical protein